MRSLLFLNKKGFEFSFAWIFAIIVGMAILFLAIFAVTRMIKTENDIQNAETGSKLGILLTPLETGAESGKATTIKFLEKTSLFNSCKNIGTFGYQEISVSENLDSKTIEKEDLIASKFYNKYIFSKGIEKGKIMSVFVKPFEFPFKIADLTYIWSESYCFVSPPNEIEEEILALSPRNLNVSLFKEDCPIESKSVCFDISGCDIEVFLSSKKVRKDNQEVYYDSEFGNALLYGAIFADSKIYECQIKRLMKRASELSLLETAKSEYLGSRGCSSGLMTELSLFADKTREIDNSGGLDTLGEMARQLKIKNENLICELF